MMSKEEMEKMPLDKQEQFINEREAFYRGIVNVVEDASTVIEPVNRSSTNTCYIHDKFLKDFYGFDIKLHSSYTDDIEIKKNGKIVLSLAYQGKDDLPVLQLVSKDRSWENEMKEILKDPQKHVDGFIARVKGEEEMYKQKEEKRRQESIKREKLMEKANKMGLIKETRSRY